MTNLGHSDAGPTARPPAEPEAWIWAAGGHWEAALESIQDARNRTRGQARARYESDTGEPMTNISVWKRWACSCSVQEQWEAYCDSCGWYEPDPDGEDGAEREMSPEPPKEWIAPWWNEDIPSWRFCRRDDEGAVPVWVCAPHGIPAPPNPMRTEGANA